MLSKEKSDPALGLKIHQHLLEHKVETPITGLVLSHAEHKIKTIEPLLKQVWETLGLDLTDDSLAETPKRIAKMLVLEKFYGLDYSNFPKATTVENKFKYDEMVLERKIKINSICEHHGIEIIGQAHIAYIPDRRVLGLSKLNRIADFFSRRPQIQERLTEQIYFALQFILETHNIAVCIDAEHMCVKTRGIMDACSDTVTSKLGGTFRLPEVRNEFYNLISLNRN